MVGKVCESQSLWHIPLDHCGCLLVTQ